VKKYKNFLKLSASGRGSGFVSSPLKTVNFFIGEIIQLEAIQRLSSKGVKRKNKERYRQNFHIFPLSISFLWLNS